MVMGNHHAAGVVHAAVPDDAANRHCDRIVASGLFAKRDETAIPVEMGEQQALGFLFGQLRAEQHGGICSGAEVPPVLRRIVGIVCSWAPHLMSVLQMTS